MWSWSVDLAHHYALSYRIFEQWVLINPNDPTLGEMNIYPRISHIIAAIFGVLVNCTFLGMQITTLTFLALLWMSILLTLSSLQVRLAITSIIILLMIVVFNAFSLKLDIHGHEVVGNFFYSQLIGHSVLYIGIAIAIYLEKSKGPVSSIVFLTVLMLVNAGIHLLPALEMLGLIYALLIVYVFLGNNGSTLRFRLLVACGIAFAAILGIIFHPSFAAMRAISANDGALGLNNISYPNGLILVCVILIAISYKVFIKWIANASRNDNIAIKYFASYGEVIAILCLFQFFLTKFGYGSDYAVKKYSFGLVTILFVNVSILVSGYFNSISLVSYKIPDLVIYRIPIIIFSLCTLFILSVPCYKSVDVSDIVAQERRLIALNYTGIPVPELGKSNVIIGLDQIPNTANYMFSIAILKTPRKIAIPDVLVKNDLPDLSLYSYVISESNHPAFSLGCNINKGALSIASSQCLQQRKYKPILGLSDLQFSSWGRASFINNKRFIESNEFTDAALLTNEIKIPRGSYRLKILLSYSVESENIRINAAHVSIHGKKILIPINTSSKQNESYEKDFFNDGEPFQLSIGLGGWSKGKGFLRIDNLEILSLIEK